MNFHHARLRAELSRWVRVYFSDHDYVEVDTPLTAEHLIPESGIDIFTTRFRDTELYLIPSPEIWMKKLLARGSGNIFQICRCFRNSESLGRLHNPEFTMLEWYTVEADYRDSLVRTKDMLKKIGHEFRCGVLGEESLELTMQEAFAEYTGIDLRENIDIRLLKERGEELGIGFRPQDSWETVFNRIFLSRVEPELPADRPVFLTDYPRGVPCLAKPVSGTPWLERWELYAGGMELANCFTEENDPSRIRSFFEDETAQFPDPGKHRVDWEYVSEMGRLPSCSGVALGVDRLLMVLAAAERIGEVLLFPYGE